MTELVKVEVKNGEQLVSARELHEFLEVGSKFNDWFKRMCEYGFIENEDFVAITQKKVTAQGNESEFTDYILKITMAKEISMLQRNEKGKQARMYFIECEKKVNSITIDSYMIEDKVERAKKWIEEEETRKQLELEVKVKEEVIKEQAPKVEYYEKVLDTKSRFTTTQVAKLYDTTAKSLNSILQTKKVQFYQSGQWHLYSNHQGKGYEDIRTHLLDNGDSRKSMVWTEKGIEFIGRILEDC